MEDLIQKLKNLGLNSYEAKVYIALLKKYPATGYEISQCADIPQSRAYDALKSLVNEKLAFSSDEKPQKYTPIAPKELTQRYKRKMNSTLDYLEKKLPNVKEFYNEPIHSIQGYENIINKIKEIIKNTKNSIYIEIWNEDFKLIETTLREAYDNEVDVKIVGYNSIKSNFGMIYNHDGGKEFENTFGSRGIYIVSDNNEGLFGTIEADVIWTKNPHVVLLLKEFIIHDMYLLDVGENFPEQLKYFYGTGFRRLKEKILTYDSPYNIH